MKWKTENKIQSACYKWFHNNYPLLRGLLCYNLNNTVATIPAPAKDILSKYKILAAIQKIYIKYGAIAGGINKMLGLQKGRSDMVFYYKGTAIMIEFKTETGTQSPEQIVWQKKIEKARFEYYIVRNLPEFQNLIKSKL